MDKYDAGAFGGFGVSAAAAPSFPKRVALASSRPAPK